MTDTPVKRLNVVRLAIIGAGTGLVYALARVLLGFEDLLADQAEEIAYVVGGMVGGAILFAVLAAIWNRFAR